MHTQKNSNCELYRDMLYDYVSDNLSEQDRADFVMHINSCPDCKRELDELNAILGAASEIEEVEVPDSVRAAVSASLAAESVKLRNRKKIYKFTASTVLPIAACAALAIGIYSGGIYDDINKADDMITDAPVQTQPMPAPQGETVAPVEEPAEEAVQNPSAPESSYEEAPQKSQSNASAKPQKKQSSATKNNSASNRPAEAVTVSEPTQSDAVPAEDTSTPEKTAEAVSEPEVPKATNSVNTASEPAEKKSDSSRNMTSGGGGGAASGGSSGARIKSAKPTEEPVMEEAIPAPASTYAVSEDAVEESADACYDGEAYEEEHEKDDKPTAQGYCTVSVADPSAFAKGFGINKSGSSITFTIPANRWREFVNYCRSYGVSLNASFPESEYSSVTVTVTQGR